MGAMLCFVSFSTTLDMTHKRRLREANTLGSSASSNMSMSVLIISSTHTRPFSGDRSSSSKSPMRFAPSRRYTCSYSYTQIHTTHSPSIDTYLYSYTQIHLHMQLQLHIKLQLHNSCSNIQVHMRLQLHIQLQLHIPIRLHSVFAWHPRVRKACGSSASAGSAQRLQLQILCLQFITIGCTIHRQTMYHSNII